LARISQKEIPWCKSSTAGEVSDNPVSPPTISEEIPSTL